tara:strand:+ start:2568 stop:4118 length:1551 start_codon:yes stop_codon:yes gene_type:complete
MSKVDVNDQKTWDLFKNGYTKGVFQLESNHGRNWSRKLAPSNLEELSALIAIIRPGTQKEQRQQFVDRKHGREEVTYLDKSLEEILKKTYGILVYQEQSMRIAQKLAGFDLKEADELRKAIGKKKADLMAKIKTKFIKGCIKQKAVTKEASEEIFGWIEKSARYAFNKSHSVAYAVNAYNTAWYKANHTTEFFLSYLYYAADKQYPHQEVYELVSEAKLFSIETKIPNLTQFSEKFVAVGKDIYFGVKDVKSLTGVTGDKVISSIAKVEEETKIKPNKLTWLDVLIYLSPKINATAFKALSSIGFFSTKATRASRNKALYEYEIFKMLTKKEKEWVLNNYSDKKWTTLEECMIDLCPTKKNGGGTHNVARSQLIENELEMIRNPPYSLDDEPSWIVAQEVKLLGCPISLAKIDAADTSEATTTCKEIVNGKHGKNLCVAGNIVREASFKTKNGKSAGQLMSFLTIEDDSCVLDGVVVFPETRKLHEYMLYEGNNLLFCGEVKRGDNSFIIEKIHEI